MSTATLTTADVQAFAIERIAELKKRATTHYASALLCPGEPLAMHHAQCIEWLTDHANGLADMALLCNLHHDDGAAAAIRKALKEGTSGFQDMAHVARMTSIPGWDPATRSFRKEPA